MDYEKKHSIYKVNSIRGRYLNLDKIESILQEWNAEKRVVILGKSVQGKPIYNFKIGHGKTKILMWSQMHGNESTTTKGLLDFLNFLQNDTKDAKSILENYTFYVIPMLNPDGAELYTRVNANEIDLNRDFQNLTQPESRLLMELYQDFKPDFCFNLHDQRTIFGVGTSGKPATVSFLAPSFNEFKTYDEARLKSVAVIMKMESVLKTLIPGQIGRFDDAFNANCVGDTFQALNTPTILLEAGHYPQDYEREITRKYVFIALLSAFENSNENLVVDNVLFDYLKIPQNIPNFFDFVFKNVKINYDKSDIITNFAVQFKEELKEDKIIFNGFIDKPQNLDSFFGHIEYDATFEQYTDKLDSIPKQNTIADFSIGNKVIFVNGLIKNQ